MPLSNSELLSYAAGIIDGEGWIGMARIVHQNRPNPSYGVRIKVNMASAGPVKLLYELFGGNLRILNPSSERYKIQTQWELNERIDLARCLLQIEHRLITKAEHARVALEYLSKFNVNERNNSLRESYYLKFKELNK